ncbi:MAG: MMPL family transporter [Candidatus Sericytochromatia bacterium]|nr:MMPL family transporter [Candidatus Tanganyikabacteria bacterium]
MELAFAAMGRWIHRNRLRVIVAWILLFCLGSLGASQLPHRLFEGSSEIPGTESARMERVLREEFDNPYTRALIVGLTSDKFTVDDPTYQRWIRGVIGALRPLPEVQELTTWLDLKDKRLRSPDGHQTAVMVGMRVKSLEEEQRAVPRLRAALADLKAEMKATDPAARAAVTGRAAILYDIDTHMKRDGEAAESKAVPLSMIILLGAFGALVAAGIPLLVAMLGITIAMGMGFLLTMVMPVSTFIVNIATMLGLAVGIDYSLLMVNRFRKALAEGLPVGDAVAETTAKAGTAVLYSGLTVMISMTALFLAPLVEFRGIGIGGCFVVVVSVAAVLTLVPATLSLVGERVDAPRWLSSRMRLPDRETWWRNVAGWVMDRPWRVLVAGTIAVLAIAWPALQMDTGFSNSRWFPLSMECRQGIEILGPLQQYNAVIPIYAVVRAPAGEKILQTKYIPKLHQFARKLQGDERVGSVLSPVTLRDDLGLLQYLMLYRNSDRALERFPQIKQLLLSKDGSAALFQIIPANHVLLRETQALSLDVAKLSVGGPLKLEVGGEPAYYNDFVGTMNWAFPLIIGVVLSVTLVVLFVAFRSYLLPIKAVVMNLLSVGAGFGVLVMVFQFGWGASLFGMSEAMGAVPISIPVFVFCLTFGLSMDYEVFLLTRIKEIYDETGDNRHATAEGLASTGGIITNAAAIMVVVFGAFAFVEMPLGKMMGLGLATTVLVDATIIRIFLVPAFMRIAGRWNWVPGHKAPERLALHHVPVE